MRQLDDDVEKTELPDDHLHLWYATPQSVPPERYAGKVQILSPEERKRWEAFRFDSDRHHYLAAHLLLRHALCRYVDCLPQHLRFARGPFGKPSLAEPRVPFPLEFSLTHTRGLVACAVARHPVGVDAEWLDQEVDLGLASTVLAPQEFHDLQARPPAERPSRFLEYWTLKEAFIKATGKGLSQPLERFWFRLERAGRPAIGFAAGESAQADRWQFLQLDELSPAHRLALAVKLPAPIELKVRTRNWC